MENVLIPKPFCFHCLNVIRPGQSRITVQISLPGIAARRVDFGSIECAKRGLEDIDQRRGEALSVAQSMEAR